jgi:acetyl coenzyme A synthetase (ADP forming)-like protein
VARDGDPGWDADVVLSDGGTVHLRAATSADGPALSAFYARLSEHSRYQRFLGPTSAGRAAALERVDDLDPAQRLVLVAELGDAVVAAAQFDRHVGGDADVAEVAFAVQDDHQGRGLGTILLEHLAVAARALGVRRFVAETLASNRAMLRVFADAGFAQARANHHGLVEVALDLTPTDEVTEALRHREHVSEARSVARLLAPQSVAVIGASRRSGTIGNAILRNLLAGDFTGTVSPVNPGAASVAGVRAYPSVLDVPGPVDVAIVAVPAEHVLAVAAECATKGVDGLVVISAGFREVAGGGDRERELVQLARRNGMRVVGPNCMGVLNTAPDVRMNATFAPYEPLAGAIGFASQSGGLGIGLLAKAHALGLGVSTFVSMGNKADVSSNDLLQYWEDDPATRVILLYLESFGNPRKFARIARRVGRTKPIVAVKSGRTAAGARGTSSHTASLAAPDVAVDALFRQAGVIRVDTLEELYDTARLLASQPLPAGRRVAIVSNGGGPGILAADACAGRGLEVPELGSATQAALRGVVAPEASVANPVDLVASASAETYEAAVRIVLEAPDVDAVMVLFVAPLVTQRDDVVRALYRAVGAEPRAKTVLACFLGDEGVLADDGVIPNFAFAEAAAGALALVAEHAEWRNRDPGVVPELPGVDVVTARALVAAALDAHPDGVWLDPPAARELLACFAIPVVTTRAVSSAAEAGAVAAELGVPVALKAGSGALVHKSDVGGVRLGLEGAEVGDAFTEMQRALGDAMGGAVVQPMVGPGVETIVGVTQDASFGPLVLLGLGGLAAELTRDTAVRLTPLTSVDAHELVRSLRGSPLLFGYRGTPVLDSAALEDLLLRVGLLADALPEAVELDCNPVIVTVEGATVVDVKVRLVPGTRPVPPGLRRL